MAEKEITWGNVTREDFEALLAERDACESVHRHDLNRIDELQGSVDLLVAEHERQLRRVAVLEAALQKYGHHIPSCAANWKRPNPAKCKCGFTAVLAGGDAAEEQFCPADPWCGCAADEPCKRDAAPEPVPKFIYAPSREEAQKALDTRYLRKYRAVPVEGADPNDPPEDTIVDSKVVR